MSRLLALTCPSGRQCQHLIPLLYNRGAFRLRLAAHSSTSVARLQEAYPDAEVVQVDLNSLDDCRKLLRGTTAVYHIGPTMHSREAEMGFNMIDAAIDESRTSDNIFEHFVFSSVLCTQHTRLMQHDLKARIEERLFLSPLNYTILQPTSFLDAFPVLRWRNDPQPVMERLRTPGVMHSFIALRDLAEASARVLAEGEKHYFAQYPLCSTMPIADEEVASIAGEALGKEIQMRTRSIEAGVQSVLSIWGEQPITVGDQSIDEFKSPAADGDSRPDIVRDAVERLILFYRRRGLKGNPSVLRWLLGREPTSVKEWIHLQLG